MPRPLRLMDFGSADFRSQGLGKVSSAWAEHMFSRGLLGC